MGAGEGPSWHKQGSVEEPEPGRLEVRGRRHEPHSRAAAPQACRPSWHPLLTQQVHEQGGRGDTGQASSWVKKRASGERVSLGRTISTGTLLRWEGVDVRDCPGRQLWQTWGAQQSSAEGAGSMVWLEMHLPVGSPSSPGRKGTNRNTEGSGVAVVCGQLIPNISPSSSPLCKHTSQEWVPRQVYSVSSTPAV